MDQLPPPGPQARQLHRRRGRPHHQAAQPTRQQVVPDRRAPPGPHRQRDQELLEHAHPPEAHRQGHRPRHAPPHRRRRQQRHHLLPARRPSAAAAAAAEAAQVPRPQPGPLHQPALPPGRGPPPGGAQARRRQARGAAGRPRRWALLRLQPGPPAGRRRLQLHQQPLPGAQGRHTRLQRPRDEVKVKPPNEINIFFSLLLCSARLLVGLFFFL